MKTVLFSVLFLILGLTIGYIVAVYKIISKTQQQVIMVINEPHLKYQKGDSIIINETIYREGKFLNDTNIIYKAKSDSYNNNIVCPDSSIIVDVKGDQSFDNILKDDTILLSTPYPFKLGKDKFPAKTKIKGLLNINKGLVSIDVKNINGIKTNLIGVEYLTNKVGIKINSIGDHNQIKLVDGYRLILKCN